LFPLRGVPPWMAWLATIDPVTYGVDSLRQAVLRRSVPAEMLRAVTIHQMATNVVVMALLCVAFIIPAVWQFWAAGLNRPDLIGKAGRTLSGPAAKPGNIGVHFGVYYEDMPLWSTHFRQSRPLRPRGDSPRGLSAC
jgi:hypothetical protein